MGSGFDLEGIGRRWSGAAFLLALCMAPNLHAGTDPALAPQVSPATSAWAPVGSGYHDLGSLRSLLNSWVESGGANVRWVASFGEVPAIEFGGGDLDRFPFEKRRTVLLVAGLDGRSVAGGEAVLGAGFRLLTRLDTLRPDLAFLLIPWASPEGLAQVDRGRVGLGRDLDGDGLVLEMLVEDPAGPWTSSADPRFLCAAQPGDAPRYLRVTEGEDGAGSEWAYDLEDQFPLLTDQGDARQAMAAPDGPVAESLRRFVLERPCALVLSFQGNHGGLAYPGAASEPPWSELPDASLYENLGRAFQRICERPGAPVQSLLQAREGVEKGSFVDWCYTVPGVLAMEIAPWGMGLATEPGLDMGTSASRDPWDFRREPEGRGRLWAHWLDEDRGGVGFSEWRPVVTPNGQKRLVGGWLPKNYWNPPADELEDALKGLPEFVDELVQRLPYVELCDVFVEREGELCTIRARMRCVGSIPMQPQVFGRWAGSGETGSAWLRIDQPSTVERIAGPDEQSFPRLESGGRTPEVLWVLFAPEGVRMDLRFGMGGTELGHRELVL